MYDQTYQDNWLGLIFIEIIHWKNNLFLPLFLLYSIALPVIKQILHAFMFLERFLPPDVMYLDFFLFLD